MRNRKTFGIIGMVHEIRTLSSGTVSRLCDSTVYDYIEVYTSDWVAWVLRHDLTKRWKCWQDCHEEYEADIQALYEARRDLEEEIEEEETRLGLFAACEGEEDDDEESFDLWEGEGDDD